MGIAVRTGEPIELNLADCMWKLIVVSTLISICYILGRGLGNVSCALSTLHKGEKMQVNDLAEIDADYLPGLEWWMQTPVSELNFNVLDFPCTTPRYIVHSNHTALK